MKKQYTVKVLSILFAVLVVTAQLIIPVSAARTASFTLSSDKGDATVSNDETVTVMMNVGTGFKSVNGIKFAIEYPTAYLTYVDNSFGFYSGTLSGATVYSNSKVDANTGSVTVAWDSETAVKEADGTRLAYLQFKVNSNAKKGIATVKAKIESMYSLTRSSGKLVLENINCLTEPQVNVNIGVGTTAVENVTNLINQIGEVTYTPECKARIDAALNAYYSLTVSQRNSVKNFATLNTAINKYQQLSESAGLDDYYANYITKYINTYLPVLQKSITEITLADADTVKAAYNALLTLPAKAQTMLLNEADKAATSAETLLGVKNGLKLKLETVAKLQQDEDAKKKYEEECALADKMLEDLNKNAGDDIKAILKDGKEGVNAGAVEAITKVKSLIDGYFDGGAGDKDLYAYYLKIFENLFGTGAKDKFDDIYKYVEYLATPAMKNATRFRGEFASVLALTPDTVKASDKTDILIAYTVLSWLDDDTLKELSAENALIQSLMEAAGLVSDDDSSDDSSAEIEYVYVDSDSSSDPAQEIINETIRTITKTKLINKTGVGNYLVNLAHRDMGVVVWVLLCLVALTAIIFAVLRIVYYNYKKKMTGGSVNV